MTASNTLPDPAIKTELTDAEITLSESVKAQIDHWVAKYPSDKKQSALLPALLIAQKHHQGWLPLPVINAVADYLDTPRMTAYEVATFYTMFDLSPVGKHKISVCTNVSCLLNGCDRIVQYLKSRLKIDFGETTSDGLFTLKEVECLGACVSPPVMMLDETYHENLTPEKVESILDEASSDPLQKVV